MNNMMTNYIFYNNIEYVDNISTYLLIFLYNAIRTILFYFRYLYLILRVNIKILNNKIFFFCIYKRAT